MKARLRLLAARMRTRAFWTEALMLGAIAGACAAVTFLVSTRLIVKSADAVLLDDLRGRDAGDAAVWLTTRGLRPEIAHFEDNDRATPFSVVFHEPPGGEELRPGHVVRLVISRGARTVPVPDVRGIYSGQARLILERNGLAFGEPLPIHDESPTGTVIATAPGTSTPVHVGTSVRLLVSKGPRPRAWIAPDVTWSLYDSVDVLAGAMGVPVRISSRFDTPEEPEGIVLEQFPAAGARLVEGQPFRLAVNGAVGQPAKAGGADLVALSVKVPHGFSTRMLTVKVVRAGWVRTLYDQPVFPGERVRLVAAVQPGDRAVATLDGRDILVRTF